MKIATRSNTMIQRMREIRDQISREIMNMSWAEERAYISEELKKLKAERKKANR